LCGISPNSRRGEPSGPANEGGDAADDNRDGAARDSFGEPNAFFHLHLAEAYKKVGRNDDARKEIKKILSMTPDPNYQPEYKEASAAAQKLLDQIDHGG